MNNSDLIRLGLPANNRDLINEFQQKVEKTTPLSIDTSVKDSQNYDTQTLKNINVGTLRHPIDLLTVHTQGTDTYYPLTGGPAYHFSKQDYTIQLNGNIDTYQSSYGQVDLENPYDPISFSFNRLYSSPLRIVNSGKLTGVGGQVTGYLSSRKIQGDKETFYEITSGSILGNATYKGFFKKSYTRQSKFKTLLVASGTNVSNLLTFATGDGTVRSFPANSNWKFIPYPQTYNTNQYKEYEHDVIIVPRIENNSNLASGFMGTLVISTGYDKNIVYVSPHSLKTFSGFSFVSGALQTIGTGEKRSIFLHSGNFIAPDSMDHIFTGLDSVSIFASGAQMDSFTYYNSEHARLKQTTPLKDTAFYKLYEKIYKLNSFNTGTWNGVIPQGTPFSIEIVRGASSVYGSTDINFDIYVKDYFVAENTYGSGLYTNIVTSESSELGTHGTFYGTALEFSNKSANTARYITSTESFKKSRSKLIGCLWDRGFTKTNAKVRNVVKLFNSGVWPNRLYCEKLEDGTTVVCESGILTSAGIRKSDGSLLRNQNPYSVSGGFKFTRSFDSLQSIPSGTPNGVYYIRDIDKQLPIVS
jgi:hypothetical protein